MVISLGIDPGTTNVALAVVQREGQRWRLVHLPRLKGLDDALRRLNVTLYPDAHSVDIVAAEQVTWSTAVKKQGHQSTDILRIVGAGQLFAEIVGAEFIEVAPNTWRKCCTGSGNATKKQVREVLSRTVLDWPKRMNQNQADAVAIAIAGAMKAGAR